MGFYVSISVTPSEVPEPIPFPEDRTHATYNPAQAQRFHTVLTMVDIVMKEHCAQFRGRTTPVHFFWGSFDLALTRYSGRLVDPTPGTNVITHFSSDAEEVCAGWWPGDHRLASPAFFAYAYPAPAGIEAVRLRPNGAAWSPDAGEFLFRYDDALASPDPRQAIREFLTSSYEGAAKLLGWSRDLTTFPEPASPTTDHASRRST